MDSLGHLLHAGAGGLGRRYIANQKGSHKNPSRPMMAKQICQPRVRVIHRNSVGPAILAKLVPKFTTPMAVVRWAEVNHSPVALFQAGKFGASPLPNSSRGHFAWMPSRPG